MLNLMIGGITCRLSLLFPAVLLCMLWWDPSGLVVFGVLAAVLHELGHLCMCLVLHQKPRCLTISFFGMRLSWDTDHRMSYRQECLIAAAGPLANVLCAVLFYAVGVSSAYAVFHIALAAVNLLPVAPLDGERMLSSLLYSLNLRRGIADGILQVAAQICFICLTLLGIAVCVHSGYNFTLLIFAFYVGILMLFYKGN